MTKTFIPEEKIQEILKKVDIVDIISDYIPLSKKGNSYKAICPFHDDHDPSLSVSREKQIYKCFVCGMGGNAINFVQNYNNITFQEAARIVAEKANIEIGEIIDVNNVVPTHIKKAHNLLADIKEYASYQLLTNDGQDAIQYLLKDRLLTKELIKEFGIGYIPDSKKLYAFLEGKGYSTDVIEKAGIFNQDQYSFLNRRISFPIHDKDGNTIAFSARTIKNEQAKYMNSYESEVYQKGKHLYNLERAKQSIQYNKEVILMEGQMNVIRAENFGIHNAVAQLGTALSEKQIRLLKSLNAQVKLCYDGDKAGQIATLKNYQLLQKAGIKTSLILLPNNMDPDELLLNDSSSFMTLIKENPNVLDYLLKQTPDMTNFESKEKYTMYFLKTLNNFNDPLAEDFYIQRLSEKTGFKVEAIQKKYSVLSEALKTSVKTKVYKKTNKIIKETKWEPNRKIGIHLSIKKRLIFKDEVKKNFDRFRPNNLVLAFDHDNLLERSDVLKKYIDQKGPVLETRIALYSINKDIDYAVQGITKAVADELSKSLNIPKNNLDYIAYFQKHLDHPSLCIQFYQQEAFLDSYDLSNQMIVDMKQTIDEEIKNLQGNSFTEPINIPINL